MLSLKETAFLTEAYIISGGKKELVCSGNTKKDFGFDTHEVGIMK